jgi:hypothetical protein
MINTSHRLQLLAGRCVYFHERIPSHRPLIIQLVLPIHAADIRPNCVDTAASIGFVQIPAHPVTPVHPGCMWQQVDTLAALHAAVAGECLAVFRHRYPG